MTQVMLAAGPALDWRLAAAVALLVVVTVGVGRWGMLGTERRSVIAVARATAQLIVVSFVIGAVLQAVWSAFAFAGVMAAVATMTSAGRADARRSAGWVAVALLAGAGPVLAIIFATGATPISPPGVVAICGIVIGGSMTACSLVLRRSFAAMRDQRGQIEAALALGLSRRDAIALVIDRDRPEALVPVLDQTRTVGLVTLPGAFVGVLLGGGSATEAAAAQLLVLAGLVAAETVAVVVAGSLVARGRILPPDLAETLPPA